MGRFPSRNAAILVGISGHGTTCPQRLRERSFIEVVEFPSNREAVGKLSDSDREAFQPVGQIVGGSLAFERRVHRKHNLVDSAARDTRDQRVHGKILGTHALECGKPSAQDVKGARKQAGPIQSPQVGNFLDDTQQACVPAWIGANRARILGVDVAAHRTYGEPLADEFESPQQRRHRGFALLEQMQNRTAGRARSESG